MSLKRMMSVLSVLWCLLVSAYGWTHPPVLSLDLSAQDTSTVAAYTAAVWRSRVFWALLAVTPLLVIFVTSLLRKRPKG